MTTFQEQLDLVVERTKHERYRWLCSDENPDVESREGYRAEVIRQATGQPHEMPSITRMAGNALAAAGRVVKAVATGEQVRVSPNERDRRWALCLACPNLVNDRCKLCGCHFLAKIELATERCPLDPPKWEATS